MHSVADDIRRERARALAALTVVERIELALRLGDDDVRLYLPDPRRGRVVCSRSLRTCEGRRPAALRPDAVADVTLIDQVSELLAGRGISHALIGAAALAAYGISRATLDRDLLVTDRRVLDDELWSPLRDVAGIDIRRGDADDPLAGVVWISQAGERDVDVVVGRDAWQTDVLRRARHFGPGHLAVVEAADLVLLKLYAGGLQDRSDIEQLLQSGEPEALRRDVNDRLSALPRRARELWERIIARDH